MEGMQTCHLHNNHEPRLLGISVRQIRPRKDKNEKNSVQRRNYWSDKKLFRG